MQFKRFLVGIILINFIFSQQTLDQLINTCKTSCPDDLPCQRTCLKNGINDVKNYQFNSVPEINMKSIEANLSERFEKPEEQENKEDQDDNSQRRILQDKEEEEEEEVKDFVFKKQIYRLDKKQNSKDVEKKEKEFKADGEYSESEEEDDDDDDEDSIEEEEDSDNSGRKQKKNKGKKWKQKQEWKQVNSNDQKSKNKIRKQKKSGINCRSQMIYIVQVCIENLKRENCSIKSIMKDDQELMCKLKKICKISKLLGLDIEECLRE